VKQELERSQNKILQDAQSQRTVKEKLCLFFSKLEGMLTVNVKINKHKPGADFDVNDSTFKILLSLAADLAQSCCK